MQKKKLFMTILTLAFLLLSSSTITSDDSQSTPYLTLPQSPKTEIFL